MRYDGEGGRHCSIYPPGSLSTACTSILYRVCYDPPPNEHTSEGGRDGRGVPYHAVDPIQCSSAQLTSCPRKGDKKQILAFRARSERKEIVDKGKLLTQAEKEGAELTESPSMPVRTHTHTPQPSPARDTFPSAGALVWRAEKPACHRASSLPH